MGKIKAILFFILMTAGFCAVQAQLPQTLREFDNQTQDTIKNEDRYKILLNIETGPVFSNQAAKFDSIDLDGPDNIYGEKDVLQDGFYLSTGLNREFKNGCSVYASYSLVKLNKNKIASIGDTLSLDDQYPVIQHQFYASGDIAIGKGFYFFPAFNYVNERYEAVMPTPGADAQGYLFPLETFRLNYFIGYLQVTKEFRVLKPGVFAAVSNLNDKTQLQAGVHLLVLPFGNLNFCLSSRLLDHRDDNVDYIIFEQVVGLKLSHSIRAEAGGTFGKMSNYFEDNASVVYNLADKMKFKGNAKISFTPGPNIIITGEYLYLFSEGEYITCEPDKYGMTVPLTRYKDFSSQVFIIGVKWKL